MRYFLVIFVIMKHLPLIVVDVLYDFIDGSLACQGAQEAIAATLEYIRKEKPSPILFIRDHHPADHCSFAAQGGPWPPHCVQGTHGAAIHESLVAYAEDGLTFFKGEDPLKEQYSGFEGVNPAGQQLGEVLRLMELDEVVICGIATEYCVRNTAEDLIKDGFRVSVLREGLAYVDKAGHDTALKEMEAEGIHIL